MPNTKQEIVMETTHGRREKCKTEFKAVINKVLVTGLILTTLMSGTIMPAYAASNYQVSVGNNVGVTQQYGVSVQSEIQNIRNTIQAINVMRENGFVTDSMLQKLASQLYSLDRAVDISGTNATAEVLSIVSEAENVIKGLDNTASVEAAIIVLKSKYGANEESYSANNKEAHVAITSFSDIGPSHWAYKDVMIIANKGIIAGTTAPVNGVGTYNPSGNVTVGEFLTLSTRLVASDKIQDEGNFAHWAVPYYMAAIDAGLITPQQFACTPEVLNAPMTREDMAMVLVKIAEVNGENLEVRLGIENNISDYSKVDTFKKDAVRAAYSNGLLTGKDTSGRFDPTGVLTRAEVATVFCRVMNYTNRPVVVVQSNPGTSGDSQTVQSEYSKYVVTEDVETKGVLRPTYSEQYNKEAMNGVKMGEDANGVYVEVTAPVLPDVIKGDFEVRYRVVLSEPNGDYFAENVNFTLNSGETKKVYFNSFEDTKVLKGQIGSATIRISVDNTSNGRYMKSITVDSYNKSKARVDRYDGTNPSTIDYNSNHIFVGIGK